MVIRTADGGQVQVRDMFSGVDAIPLPSQAGGNYSVAGRRVSTEKAVGLPAMLRGIRVLSETVGSLPVIVYRGDPSNPDTKTVVSDAPQYDLLSKKPNELQTPFDFKACIVASILGWQGAFILKAKSRGVVQELWPIDPSRVKVEHKGTSMKYKVRLHPEDAAEVTMTRADLIHIPGTLLKDPYVGVSPIITAANAVGTALAAEEFAGRFYENDATPGGVIEGSPNSTQQQAKEVKELWEDAHRGSRKARKIGALFGGSKYTQIGVDAQSAQIIETQKWSVDQVANVLGLPAWILGGADRNPRSTPEERNMELLQFSIAPHLVRIEQALHADSDLFPDKELAPQFLADGLLRASMAMRFEAWLKARQAGWMCADEIRSRENMPPLPDGTGKEFQMTPVGGAPNLQPGNGGTEASPADTVVEPASPVT